MQLGFPGLSMGHIYLSHSHPIAIYAYPIPWDVSLRIPIGMTFPWTSLGLSMGHIYLSHPITIYACSIPWDVSHGIPIGMTFPACSADVIQYYDTMLYFCLLRLIQFRNNVLLTNHLLLETTVLQ